MRKLKKYRVLHIAKDGLLIARGKEPAPIAAPVFREEVKMKYLRIGNVADVFGPVEKPYIAIRLDSKTSVDKLPKFVYVDFAWKPRKFSRK